MPWILSQDGNNDAGFRDGRAQLNGLNRHPAKCVIGHVRSCGRTAMTSEGRIENCKASSTPMGRPYA